VSHLLNSRPDIRSYLHRAAITLGIGPHSSL